MFSKNEFLWGWPSQNLLIFRISSSALKVEKIIENYDSRNFKGVWFAKEIWLDDRLSIVEKGLLIEIDSLDQGEDHCYASNKYFADFLQVSESTVTRGIRKLKELGYISDLGITEGRTRHIQSNLHFVVGEESLVKMSRHPSQNDEAASSNCRHNNTSNNTKNNSVDVEKNTEEFFDTGVLIKQEEINTDFDIVKCQKANKLEILRYGEVYCFSNGWKFDVFNTLKLLSRIIDNYAKDSVALINSAFSDDDYQDIYYLAFKLIKHHDETLDEDFYGDKEKIVSAKISKILNKYKSISKHIPINSE